MRPETGEEPIMRRFIIAVATVAAVAIASCYGLARARPGLMPGWISRAAGVADNTSPTTAPGEPAVTVLEADADDDGWCAHLGASAPKGCPPSLPTVRLASAGIAGKIGVESARAEARQVAPTVSGNAEIAFVSHDYAHVTSRVPGRISAVPADEGQAVKKGDLLVVVDSAEVGTAKAQYLSILPVVELARRDFQRSSQLRASDAVSEKELLTAQATLARTEADRLNARQKLLNLGFDDAEIARIEKTKDTSNFLEIEAPMAGRLVERHAVMGEAVVPPSNIVTTGQSAALFEIADLGELWAWIDVGEADIPKVAIGQEVRFTISGTDEPVFRGAVQLISFSVNEATRTVRVRAGLHNVEERLRAHQYGRAEIRVGPERSAVLVPRAAVQSEGGQEFVFLPRPDGMRFRTQRVETRPSDVPGKVEVAWGLEPGDEVVTAGSFPLRTELFKSNLASEE